MGGPRTPTVHVRECTDEYVKFVLSNTDPSVANALRRAIIAHVPTIAIDLVEFVDNSTVLCDEFLAHRLGLVPLASHKALSMALPYLEEGEEKVSGVSMELHARCTEESLLVTSNDITSEDPEVLPVGHPQLVVPGEPAAAGRSAGILLCKLRRGQELHVTATARKGVGKDHAKFSPVATAVFRYMPEVVLNEAVIARMSAAQRADWCSSDPNNILLFDEATGSVSLGDVEAYAYDNECLVRAEELGFPGAVSIRKRQDAFIFTVESTGALKPAEIVLQAIDVLKEKLDLVLSDIELGG